MAAVFPAHPVLLSWQDNSDREEGSQLERGTNSEGFVVVAALPADQTFTIKHTVKKLRKLLEDEATTDQIHQTTEALGRLTAQIADDVISSAVRQSLTQQETEKP